jgi:hypothetical protein
LNCGPRRCLLIFLDKPSRHLDIDGLVANQTALATYIELECDSFVKVIRDAIKVFCTKRWFQHPVPPCSRDLERRCVTNKKCLWISLSQISKGVSALTECGGAPGSSVQRILWSTTVSASLDWLSTAPKEKARGRITNQMSTGFKAVYG